MSKAKTVTPKEFAGKLAKFSEKFQDTVDRASGTGGVSIQVGLPDDRIHIPSGLPLAQIGTIHEFGLGHMPERSFLRGAVNANKSEIKRQFQVVTQKIIDGADAAMTLEAFALWGQGMVQEYTRNGTANFTPLKQSTIDRRKKGSSNPLNDTGAMVQGIIGVVVHD